MQAEATTYYVRPDGNNSNPGTTDSAGGAWLTITKCAQTMVAGDECVVANNGTYDEVVTTVNAGTAGNPITYRAATDCVSNNGTTIAGSCAKVRRWSIGDNYIVVQGFEITADGMTTDNNRIVLISGTDHTAFVNNYVHGSTGAFACVNIGSNTNLIVRGNNVQYCYQANVVYATEAGPFNIQAGVNDKIAISIQGGATQTFTLTPDASKTLVEVATDVNATITDGGACNGAAAFCTFIFSIQSNTEGATSSIELLPVANDAYTTMGMTVGAGIMMGFQIGISGDNNTNLLVEQNVWSHVSDCYNPGIGNTAVFRDDTCGPADFYSYAHIDTIQPGAFSKVLLERIAMVDGSNIENHLMLNENASADHFIMRFMTTCRTRGGGSMSGGANDWYFYNNTFYDNGSYMRGVDGSQINAQNGATNVVARNNIWFNSRISNVTNVYIVSGTGAINKDYDLWWEQADPVETNDVNADPLLTDGANCDFTLQANSPARDAGGPLTTVAAADTGSGTSLILTDARPFQDGWAGVTPDAIAVGTVGNVAQITAINYTTGEVTIASGITRNDGDPVWLYSDSRGNRVLYGAAPDIGAFEFQPAARPARRPRRPGL